MKKFETITDLEILRYAYYGLLEIMGLERKRLENSPESKISKNVLEIYDIQFNEIEYEIIKLETLIESLRW